MMKAKKLLQQLTLDNYESILYALGVKSIKKTPTHWVTQTICHNIDSTNASDKLYLYLDTMSFFCFTECQKSRDIIDLIADRWTLLNKQFSFCDILHYICDICDISCQNNTNQGIGQPAWKKRIERYNSTKITHYLGKRYDRSIMRYLAPCDSKEFIDDGISKETMEKFGISYYAPRNQIAIPVYDIDGSLVGIHCRNLNKFDIEAGRKYIPLKTISGLDYRFKSNEVLYALNVNLPKIQQKKQVQLFESPKSVLQLDTMYCSQTTGVAMFGLNLGQNRRNTILEQGVSEVVIGIDRDYEGLDDNVGIEAYMKNVRRIAHMFKGYCKCTCLWDKDNLLDYKSSPTDKGRAIYEHLYKNRVEINV